MTKANVITLLNSMPDNFSVDEIIEKLIFVDKINQGIKDADEGRTLSNEEVGKIIASWKTNPNS